jgi:hypothetical protein
MNDSRLDIERALGRLALERQLFHSEADFQHALAWKIHEQNPDVKIRLEVPSGRSDKSERIDIVIKGKNRSYALELKYKKRKFDLVLGGEKFNLRGDVAHDISRYDFIKDVVRLERYISATENTTGYAILLTNDDLYWRESTRGVNSAAFFLHEGRTLDSDVTLAWREGTGDGTKKGRTDAFKLRSSYTIHWQDYSKISESSGATFRYIVLAITR